MANKNISGDVNVDFTEAQSRQSLESGESVKTLFGKLRKWLTDLKPVAFSGSYNDLSNKPTIPDISTKVSKSGDTMSGNLTMNNKNVILKNTTIDRDGANPSSDITGESMLTLYDKDGEQIGNIFPFRHTNGAQSLYIRCTNETTGGTPASGLIRISVDRNGAVTFALSDGSEFLSHIKTRAKNFTLKSNNIDRDGTNPSSTQVGNATMVFQDANDELVGGIFPFRNTSGEEWLSFNTYNENTSGTQIRNAIELGIAKDGTCKYQVSDPTAFRNAISAVAQSQLNTSETSDTTPYLYKSSEHDAVYDELVGCSVAWNQLIPTTGTSGDNNGVTFTNNGDGSWTLNGTTTSSLVIRNLNYAANKKNFVDGHKYLMHADSEDSNIGIAIVRDVGSAHYAYGKTAKIISYVEGSETASWARIQLSVSGYKVNSVITKPQVFDLTQMFGSTIADYAYNLEQSTAGSGVEWLKSYGFFTKDYYAYSAGGLISVNTSGKKVVGKNLLEITTESTTINGVTFTVDKAAGTVTANGTASATTFLAWKFTVEKGSYILSGCPTGGSINYYRIDIRNNVGGLLISNNAVDVGTGTTALNLTEDTDYYLNIRIQSGYITNNLVFKPMIRRADTDSTFEPHTSLTYPIQSTDLRGLYKLNGNKLYTDGDIYSADGAVTRKYGIVDLGTLDWTYESNLHRFKTTGIQNSVGGEFHKASSIDSAGVYINNIISQYIRYNSRSNVPDKNYFIDYYPSNSSLNGMLYIYDTSYTSAATFKTAMSGVYLIYELATPTIETAQPFTSPQMVYRNGTEEYLDTRDVPIPVGGNRKYVDIPEWMVNEYFDDVRAETSAISDIIEKLRRIDVTNGSSSTVKTIYAPDDSNGIRTTVRNNRTEVQVACGQASNANGKVVFTDSEIYGGIGNPTSASVNHFMFNDDCVGDSIGKLSSGSPLTGSEFDLNYETINLKGSTINIDDNMSMVFETENDFTVNTINTPYMMINTDGISLLPKTLSYFSLLISRLPSGAGSELVVDSNGTVYQSSSSKDIKHDIQYIEDTESYHDALMQIKPATYVYNNDKTENSKLGMIAEDIADVMPIAALTDENGKVENYDTRAIIAMLVMEVQRLNGEIERLKGDINADCRYTN